MQVMENMLENRYIFLTCRWSGSIRGPLGWELGVLTIAPWWPKLKNFSGNPFYIKSITLGAIYWQKGKKVNHGRNTDICYRISTGSKQSRQNRITAPLRLKLKIMIFYICYRISTGSKQTKSNYDSITARIIRPCFLDFYVCYRISTGSNFLEVKNRITVDLQTTSKKLNANLEY
jgi:hypothetical protein